METEKKNSAALKAEWSSVIDDVREKRKTYIVQRNNKDQCAIVSLEVLALAEQNKRGK